MTPKVYLHQNKARYFSTGDYFKKAADQLGIIANLGVDEYQININYDVVIHFDHGCPAPGNAGKHIYFERDAHSESHFEACQSHQRYYGQYCTNSVSHKLWDDDRVILHAADPNIHKRVIKPKYGAVFVGRDYEGDGRFYRGKWINDIVNSGAPMKVYSDGHKPADYNGLLNEGYIVFNRSFHGEINRRVFEAMAVGVCLTDEVHNLNKIGTPGEHFFTYKKDASPGEIAGIIGELLSDMPNLKRVMQNGRKLIEQKHNYKERFRQLLGKVGYVV